jgi:hypothetical protein
VYFRSALNPRAYEPYRRVDFIEALDDWGWFGAVADAPAWFNGALHRHDGVK